MQKKPSKIHSWKNASESWRGQDQWRRESQLVDEGGGVDDRRGDLRPVGSEGHKGEE
jgi:hypothetical protein